MKDSLGSMEEEWLTRSDAEPLVPATSKAEPPIGDGETMECTCTAFQHQCLCLSKYINVKCLQSCTNVRMLSVYLLRLWCLYLRSLDYIFDLLYTLQL